MAKALSAGGKKKKGGFPIFTVLLIIIVIAVGVSGFMVFQKIQQQKQQEVLSPEEDPNFVQMVSVAVVQESVETGDFITEDNVAFQEIRADSTYPQNTVFGNGIKLDGSLMFSCNAEPNTVLTEHMVWDPTLDEVLDDTSRVTLVGFLTNNTKLAEGDYIDIRMRKYSSKNSLSYQDEVVLAKKRVLATSGNKITMNLTEAEQVILNIASVDATYTNTNSKQLGDVKAMLYTTLYAAPSQEAAIATYTNEQIEAEIKKNPQLVQQAQDILESGSSVGLDLSGGEVVDVDDTSMATDNTSATNSTDAPLPDVVSE